MAVRIVKNLCDSLVGRSEIVKNSEAIVAGNFVSISGGYLANATTSGRIEGVASETYTAASDNQTVALYKGLYTEDHAGTVYEVTIDGGTITQADVGKFFNLKDASTVDGTTESTSGSNVTNDGDGTDAVVYSQLRMVGFKSSTLGLFEVARF